MLMIKIAENELEYFDKLQKEYPENILIKTEHGFDMSSSLQLVIDIADVLDKIIPLILTSVNILLLYRIQKKQNDINEKETEIHSKELDLEKAKLARTEFEIRLTSNGDSEILAKTSDVVWLQNNPDMLPQFMDNLRTSLETRNDTL